MKFALASVLRYGLLAGVLGWMWVDGAAASTLAFAVLMIVRVEVGGVLHAKHQDNAERIAGRVSGVASATATAIEALSMSINDVQRLVLQVPRPPTQRTH